MEYIQVTHSLINIAITGIMAITVSRAIAATTAITHIRAITASTRITANTTNANREMYAITAIKFIYCQAQFQLASLVTGWTEISLKFDYYDPQPPTHPPPGK